MRGIAARGLALLLLAAAGCGDGQAAVDGTLTFDGQPVEAASVTFVRSDGESGRAGAVVTGGRFEVRLPPGRYKVEVTGRKVVGTRKQKGFGGEVEVLELTEELFPDRYNTRTTLTADLTAGSNPLRLDLKSKE
jgi:hypothetical protein